MLLEGLYKGSPKGVLVDKDGFLLTKPQDPEFSAAVERGNVYIVANQSTVTTQAGLSATTPALTLANRPESTHVAKLWYAGCQSLVAWAAGAAVWLAFGEFSSTRVTETTLGSPQNVKTGVNDQSRFGVKALVVATLPAVPLAISLIGVGLTGAITTGTSAPPLGRWYNGALTLPKGCSWSFQTSTAGTLFCEFIYEVVDA